MMSLKGKVWFSFMAGNLKSPTIPGPWPRWSLRRARIVRQIADRHPAVWLAVEVGSPSHALWFSKEFARKGISLVRASGGGRWRYIWFDPKRVVRVASGLYTLPTKYQKDTKEIAWFVSTIGPHRCLFIAGHLEHKSPLSYKMNQAKEMIAYTRKKRLDYKIDWSHVFLYVDHNDSSGAIANYLNSTELESFTIGAKKVIGTSWLSQNSWKARQGVKRLVSKARRSLDWVGGGNRRNAGTVEQIDSHTFSDHDLFDVEVLYN